MTVYEMVASDLNLSKKTIHKDRIQRIINHTQAVILRFLRRDTLPVELTEVLAEASKIYFVRKYPEYAKETLKAEEVDVQEIASISDQGQSISYRTASDSENAVAKEAGLDDVLGRFYGKLISYRRLW